VTGEDTGRRSACFGVVGETLEQGPVEA
jgi:hypothetical protein